MDKINWMQVAIGFLSGGAFGAMIKQYFDNRRNRIQPVGYSIDLKPFYNSANTSIATTHITLNDGTTDYKFSNLYTGTIEIINSGLTDYSEFVFGISLQDGNNFIQNKTTTKDRHHQVEISNEPTLTNQTNTFDITLKPFNRKDRYVFDLLLTSSNLNIQSNAVVLSTSKPVKLTEISTTTDTIIAYANRTLFDISKELVTKMVGI